MKRSVERVVYSQELSVPSDLSAFSLVQATDALIKSACDAGFFTDTPLPRVELVCSSQNLMRAATISCVLGLCSVCIDASYQEDEWRVELTSFRDGKFHVFVVYSPGV